MRQRLFGEVRAYCPDNMNLGLELYSADFYHRSGQGEDPVMTGVEVRSHDHNAALASFCDILTGLDPVFAKGFMTHVRECGGLAWLARCDREVAPLGVVRGEVVYVSYRPKESQP